MKILSRPIARLTLLAIAPLALTACGGGSSTPSDGTISGVDSGHPYTVGGTVSGLVGQGLELHLFRPPSTNRGHYTEIEVLPIRGNGDFVFTTILGSGVDYGVDIEQQPHSPAQSCIVSLKYARFALAAANAADVADVTVACGEYAYVTNANDNTNSAFAIDANTGALASLGPPVTIGLTPSAITSTTDKRYLYIANNGSNDVSVFAVERGGATLSPVPGSPFAAGTNPRTLLVHTASEATYAGPNVASFLYVANTGSNDLSLYQVDQDSGVLRPLSPASYATGAGPSALAIDPSGSFLYTANTGGSSNISAFLIDERGGLTPIAGAPFPSGSSVSSFAFGADGKFLYAANAGGGGAAIYGFSVDPVSGPNPGALTSLAGFPHALPSCDFLVTDQSGAYLYAIAGTHLLGYGIDTQTGALKLLPGFPITLGAIPHAASIDPTNQFLYVGNGSDSAGVVTAFTLNATTGALTPIPGSPFAVGESPDFIATF